MAVLQSYSAVPDSETTPPKFKVFTRKDIDDIRELQSLSHEERLSMKAVSAVLPFRVNNYVIEELIDWNNIPADPIFQLTFPQPGMLERKDFEHMLELVKKDASTDDIHEAARTIQNKLNPHPADQVELDVRSLDKEPLDGMQH